MKEIRTPWMERGRREKIRSVCFPPSFSPRRVMLTLHPTPSYESRLPIYHVRLRRSSEPPLLGARMPKTTALAGRGKGKEDQGHEGSEVYTVVSVDRRIRGWGRRRAGGRRRG